MAQLRARLQEEPTLRLDLESSVGAGIRVLAALALGAVVALPATADQHTTAKPAPEAAAPAKAATDGPAVNFTPTAGVWRDRLRDARKEVLSATAALDDLNAQYAHVLYETPDDAARIKTLAKQRQSAMQRVQKARAAIPPMVAQARADGVAPRILELYEQATLDQ